MMGLPTVIVGTINGPVVINRSNYDEGKHTLYVEPESNPKKQSVDWLKAQLANQGITFDGVNKKSDLLKLYEMSHG